MKIGSRNLIDPLPAGFPAGKRRVCRRHRKFPCVTKWDWGFHRYLEEANTGKGVKMPWALKPYFQFVLPVLILVILIQGLMK